MKQIIIAGVVAALGAGAVLLWRNAQGQSGSATTQPATVATVERGPLVLSIASTGRVVSNLDVEIKCKASGEVMALPYDVSDTVAKGALLVELDPSDEQRAVRQQEVSLSSSQARLAQAKQNLLIAEKTLATEKKRAEAAFTSAQARAQDARGKSERVRQLFEKKLASQEELDTTETSAIQAAAEEQQARVRLEEVATLELSLELKRQDVRLAEAQVEAVQITLSDAQQRLKDTKVYAPIDGVVAGRTVQIGQIISSGISNVGGGTTVLTLSDLSHLFILAAVDESDIGKVAVGQEVAITADAFPGVNFRGRVARIATRGVNASNVVTFEVKIEVLGGARDGGASGGGVTRGGSRSGRPAGARSRPARGTGTQPAALGGGPGGPAATAGARAFPARWLLKPEMTANVEIIAAERANAVQVPSEAIFRKGGEPRVLVVTAPGKTEERVVEVGISDGVNSEIVSGLKDGEQVTIQKGGGESRWRAQRGPGGPMMPGLGGPRG